MKKSFILLSFALSCMLPFVSCSKQNGKGGDDDKPAVLTSTVISYVSGLDDKCMFAKAENGDLALKYCKDIMKNGKTVKLLDRTDHEGLLPLLAFQTENARFSANVFSGSSSDMYEASTLILDAPTRSCQCFHINGDSYLTSVPQNVDGKIRRMGENGEVASTKNVNIEMQFCTTRIKTVEDVSAFVRTDGVLSKVIADRKNVLIVGTVKADAAETLKSGVKDLDGKYSVQILAAGKDYALFMLSSSRFWNLNEVRTKDICPGLKAYEVDVKWS